MILLQTSSALFLDGNSATFVAAIMTWTILCFFGTRVTKKNKSLQLESSNFMQALLLMVCDRALAILTNTQNDSIAKSETENLRIFSKIIAESDEKNNPYKDKMMELVNKLQFKTVTFYTSYLGQSKRVKSLHQKVTTDTIEFFSSFFYSFLFCVFILCVDCLGDSNMSWLINMVCLIAIVSYIYWIFIWAHYCWSIKKREKNTEPVKYEFKFWTCILAFVFITAIIGLSNIFNISTETMNYIYLIIFFCTGIFAMFNYIKRGKCVFTHYFNLIHFFLIVFYISVICWFQDKVFNNDIVFTVNQAKILCVTFVIFSGLIFPLFIPIFRFRWEIFRTIRTFNKAKKTYIKETYKIKKDLDLYFNDLIKLKSLNSKQP